VAGDGADSPTRAGKAREAARPIKNAWERLVRISCLFFFGHKYDGKIRRLLFLACFIFKICATLDFKNKSCAFRNNRLISPSFLIKKNIMKKKRLVVLTGAGMSAESGIKTFRDADGLWEGHDVKVVASPQGWRDNKQLVLEFYNQRRAQLKDVVPNAGHIGVAELEEYFDVQIITQNVDDLHERAGSTKVMHIHGELLKARSVGDKNLIYDWAKDINVGDKCEKGHQLRPHIVWFGEDVPLIEDAAWHCMQADILVIIGTSMVVYPAAQLIHYAPKDILKFFIDPRPAANMEKYEQMTVIAENATTGVAKLKQLLLEIGIQ
jgi:NAD-dependent deacetylase